CWLFQAVLSLFERAGDATADRPDCLISPFGSGALLAGAVPLFCRCSERSNGTQRQSAVCFRYVSEPGTDGRGRAPCWLFFGCSEPTTARGTRSSPRAPARDGVAKFGKPVFSSAG